jgi:hypothetical protein
MLKWRRCGASVSNRDYRLEVDLRNPVFRWLAH